VAIDGEVTMTDHLAGLIARRSESEAIDGVVQTALQQAQQVLTSDALLTGRDLVVRPKLLLQNTVDALRLLFLAQRDTVFRVTRTLLAGLSRGIRTLLDATLVGVAAITLQEELFTFTAALPAVRPCVTSHRGLSS
jgi:hypothetical protein